MATEVNADVGIRSMRKAAIQMPIAAYACANPSLWRSSRQDNARGEENPHKSHEPGWHCDPRFRGIRSRRGAVPGCRTLTPARRGSRATALAPG